MSGVPQGSAQTLFQPFFCCCSSLLFLPMNHLFKKWAFHSSTSSPSTAVTFWSFRVPWLRPPGTSACPWTSARPREGVRGPQVLPRGVSYRKQVLDEGLIQIQCQDLFFRWPVRCVGGWRGGLAQTNKEALWEVQWNTKNPELTPYQKQWRAKQSWKRAKLET